MQVDLPSNSRDFQISVHKFLPNQFIGRFKTIGNVYFYFLFFNFFCGQCTYCRHFTQRFIRQKLVDKISKFLPIDSVEFTQMMPIGCLQLFTVYFVPPGLQQYLVPLPRHLGLLTTKNNHVKILLELLESRGQITSTTPVFPHLIYKCSAMPNYYLASRSALSLLLNMKNFAL